MDKKEIDNDMTEIELKKMYALYLIKVLFSFDVEDYILSYEEFCKSDLVVK